MNAPIPVTEPVGPNAKAALGHRFPVFSYGFRPFFLMAGSYAALVVPAWLLVWHGAGLDLPLAPTIWHGHEMLFGVVVAAQCGFLLTAIPNWTGAAPVRDKKLMLLAALWLAGRVTAFLPFPLLFAAFDLAFLPALALAVGATLIRRAGKRNFVFILLLALLTLANAAVHFDGFGRPDLGGAWGLHVAIAIFATMIGIVGGRVVPSFTEGGLAASGQKVKLWNPVLLNRAALAALGAFLLSVLFGLAEPIVGGAALLAALLNLVRWAGWKGWRTWRHPLILVLHVGYLWLPIGLTLIGLSELFSLVPLNAGLHALGAGASASMILAIMTRASLGHTGRKLVADGWTMLAYVLVPLGAFLRVLGSLLDASASWLIDGGGALWALGFACFALRYAPMLLSPRTDGRPG